MHFEGAGDALFCGDTLFAGYRIRSHARGHQQIGEMLGCRVIPLELVDPYYYHLDTCFCPLAPDVAIYYPAGVRRLRPLGACGARADADRSGRGGSQESSPATRSSSAARSITNTGCPNLHAALREPGFTPRETPLSEFVKAGGSAKCLTLRLDGEEAAGWRTA